MSVRLSVIIPTYKRRQILVKCLAALHTQTAVPLFEILVVDDGSTDGMQEGAAEVWDLAPDVRLFRQDHSGPAAARNFGIRQARGDLVLFLGDDIIAAPNLLAEHLAWHEQYPEMCVTVLGHVTWSPEIGITPFMHWLENGGPQFKYWAVDDPNNVSWQHLYTANISFKRRFLLESGLFDESFPYASLEDTELGYRLNRRGLRLMYNKQAVGYHYHPTSLDDALARMQRVAQSRRIYHTKTGEGQVIYQEHRRWRYVLSQLKFELARHIGYVAETRWVMPKLYGYLLDKAQHLAQDGDGGHKASLP